MFKIKIPTFIKLLCLFTLTLLACAIFQPAATPTPVPTAHPSATRTRTPKLPRRSATPTATPISLTQAARRTSAFLTKAAGSATATKTLGPTRTKVKTYTPTLTLTPTAEFPRMDFAGMTAPALSNNILGESTSRDLLIYLPASYGQPEKRYPVIYYLLDFGLKIRDVTILPEEIQKDAAAGLTKELIIVFVSGSNSLGGSFYVNSPVTGNWDDFIAQDIVRYMDEHYRTLPNRSSRGISGYAVGGFGALSVAMRHPDVFGSVYSMNPTLFDVDGLAGSPLFSEQHTIDTVLDLQAHELMTRSINDAISAMQHAGDAQFSVAYGTTFAANPQGKPPYMDYPYKRQNGGIFRDEAIWQRWEAGFGNLPNKIIQYKESLKKLSNIALACGNSTPYIWALQGCRAFSKQLTDANITNQLLTFPGAVEPDLRQGIRGYALPFFSEKLTFNQ